MTVEVSPQEQEEIARGAREANRLALEHPAMLAAYLDPQWQARAHTDLISRHLADLYSGAVRRLLVCTPPQVGKSTLVSEWFPFWWLCCHSAARVTVASYGAGLATVRGRSVRRMVQHHGWRWGLSLERGNTSVHEWSLDTRGGMKSVGIGSGITGFPSHMGVVDDPHKSRIEAESLRMRDAVWDWWSGDMLSRLSPGAPLVLVMTLWHPDDLAARVIEQDGLEHDGGEWRVLKLPALATDPATDPLGRGEGDPLTHPAIDETDTRAARLHWLDKRAQSQVRDWHALYQCDPQPGEGALVSPTLLRGRRAHSSQPDATPVKYGIGVDPSGGGRDVAGVIGGWLGDDHRLYLDRDYSVTGSSSDWAIEVAVLAAERRAEFVAIEANFGGDMAKTVVRSAWDTVQRIARGDTRPDDDPDLVRRCTGLTPGHCPQIRLPRARKGKLLRADPIAQQWSDDRMRTASYLPELEHEWCTWQPTDPDSPGRIDASVILAYALLPIPGSEYVLSSPAGESRSDVAARSRQRPRRQIQRRPIRPE